VSDARPLESKAYRHYVLAALTLAYTLNFLDRGLMVLLLQPIKEDLHLSDTQLGFLTGIAFGLFYATLGLPIARWSDRGNRVTIASLAIGLWGGTVMLCVLVSNFTQLVFARVAAAVGEAGCMPPTYSLVGDYFPGSAERTMAMSLYKLAAPLAALISFVLGGWLHETYGWRMTFFLMGVPALLIAVLLKSTVVEVRAPRGTSPAPLLPLPHMPDVLRALWRQPSFRNLSLGLILLLTLGAGLGPWYAAFMMRTHGMGTAELGVWLGLIFGLGGIAGILLGGYVCARWLAGDERAQMRASAVAITLLVPFFVAFLLLPDRNRALLALTPLVLAFNFFYAPSFVLLQRLVASEMRATSLAVVMLLANLIGMGIGPQIVGVISDVLAPAVGNDSLRYAMLTMSFVALWSAWHFWRAGSTVKRDLVAMEVP
jgi:MFS family permease